MNASGDFQKANMVVAEMAAKTRIRPMAKRATVPIHHMAIHIIAQATGLR